MTVKKSVNPNIRTMRTRKFTSLSFFIFFLFCSQLLFAGISNKKYTGPNPSFWSPATEGCGPLTVQFYDVSVSASGDPIVCRIWYFGDGDTASAETPVHTYTNTGFYQVKLVVISQSGLKDSLIRNNYVVVTTPPVVNLGNDTTICTGETLLLDAGAGAQHYLWNNGDTTQTIDGSMPGTYYVTVTNYGCSSTDTIKVTVKPTLLPKFGWNLLNSCLPQTVQFKDSSISCGVTIVEWFWDFGDGSTSYQQNPTHVYTANGNYSVKLRVKDNTGTTITRSKTLSVAASVAPVVNLGADTAICSADVLVLNAGNTGATYSWNTGDNTQTISVNSSGKYWVTVTNGSCSSTDSIIVSVTPTLLPKFGWMALTSCAPQNFQFIDSTIFCGVTPTEWFWDFGDGTTSTSQEPMHTFTANGTYTVKFTVKDNTGTSITRSKTLVVNTPTPTFTLGADTTVCDGITVVLDAGNHPGCSYYWSTGATTRTISVDISGDYWVQVYNSSCSATDDIKVTVKPALLPNFSFNQSGTCLPVTAQFTDMSETCGGTIVYWQWDFGDGITSNLQHPTHVFTRGGNFSVKLTVRDNSGNQITRGKTIFVNTNTPLVNLGADTTICEGYAITLDAGIADSYLWNTGETTASISVKDEEFYWVQVTKNGCTGWDTIHVSTNFPLVPNYNFTVTSKCLPVKTTFTDVTAITCGNAPVTYWLWDFGDGTTSNDANPVHYYQQTGVYNVKLTVRNSNGVSSSKSKIVKIETVGPVVDLGPDITVCQGNSATLNANEPDAVYKWSPGILLNNDTVQMPVATPRTTTLFEVSVSKCGVTVKDSIIVFVDSMARPNIVQSEETLTASPGIYYQWYRDGVLLDNANSRNYKPKCGGYFQVMVTNSRGCSNISDKYYFLPGGGRHLGGTKVKIKISPNPSWGIINILLSKLPEKPLWVNITDNHGRILLRTSISSNINTINLSHLGKGHYFAVIYFDKEKVTIPFLLIK